MKLPDRERLFDALFDEGEFASALDDIAEVIGARSYVGGFAFNDGSRALNISSGYFSPEQLETYYATYFEQDPWNQYVLSNWRPGRVTDADRMLTDRQIEWSGLYQGFFRPMGDDTFHAIAVPTETVQGIGAIAFQRGRARSGFSERGKDELASIAPDLARLMALRCRLQGMERVIVSQASALDALGDGMILLDSESRIVLANAAAEARLVAGDFLQVDKGRLACRAPRQQRALEDALESLVDVRHAALRLQGEGGLALELSFLALPPTGGRARALVAFANAPQPSRATLLRQLYRLSTAEAEIAVMLADGLDPADIAAARGTSLNTVRVQLRTVGEKMGCSRLIDIVRRVAALPRIDGTPA